MVFKKIIFNVVLIAGFAGNLMASRDCKELAAAGLAGGVVSVGAMYLYARESNAVKVEKVERIWRHVVDNVARARPEDFSRIIPAFKKFDIFVYELESSLQARYCSSLKPWNWLSSTKLAYKKAALLQTLFKYLDVLHYWHVAISDDSIERLGKVVCGKNYSAIFFVQDLTRDMDKVSKIMKEVYCPFGDILHEHLRAVRDILLESNAYKAEFVNIGNQV